MIMKTPSISTFLWFERDAEAAAELYTSLILIRGITKVARWGDGGPVPKGSVMTVAFELAGHPVTALTEVLTTSSHRQSPGGLLRNPGRDRPLLGRLLARQR